MTKKEFLEELKENVAERLRSFMEELTEETLETYSDKIVEYRVCNEKLHLTILGVLKQIAKETKDGIEANVARRVWSKDDWLERKKDQKKLYWPDYYSQNKEKEE